MEEVPKSSGSCTSMLVLVVVSLPAPSLTQLTDLELSQLHTHHRRLQRHTQPVSCLVLIRTLCRCHSLPLFNHHGELLNDPKNSIDFVQLSHPHDNNINRLLRIDQHQPTTSNKMPSALLKWGHPPSLATFLKSHQELSVDSAIEHLEMLLKGRLIKNSRPCAIATTHLLLHVVSSGEWDDSQSLIKRIREVGRRLIAARPREMAVGNIVRRVLSLVREVAETGNEQNGPVDDGIVPGFSAQHHDSNTPESPSMSGSIEQLPPLQRPQMPSTAGSLFNIFGQPEGSLSKSSPMGSGAATPAHGGQTQGKIEEIDLRAEVCAGIDDLLEELDIVDSQIAESALDHVHNNEIILTHTSSSTVQRFLYAAAKGSLGVKGRKFTVIHAEAYPNDHAATHTTIVSGASKPGPEDRRWKALTELGITVILIPDTAVFALMSRVNKVILAPHTVLTNGSLIATAGASTIALAAKTHRVPVVVLSGVYKLSPTYPFKPAHLIEYGDPGQVLEWQSDGEFMDAVDVVNPLYDHVAADLVDLYITNLGPHAPSFLYRIVADHYRAEDIDLS